MKKTIAILLVSLMAIGSKAQKVSDVSFTKFRNMVIINYSLTENPNCETYIAELWFSPKCDKNFTKLTTAVEGTGFVKPGSNEMSWTPSENINYTSCCFKVRVIATLKPTATTDTMTQSHSISTSFASYTETTSGLNLEMIAVKGGKFTMGSTESTDEQPTHEVTLSDFYMGKYEVTNAQFVLFLNEISTKITISENGDNVSYNGNQIFDNFCGDKKGGCSGFIERIEYDKGNKANGLFSVVKGYEKHPVVLVTWYGANEYCTWLSQKTGKKYSLPSEAQWEYAAGGGASNRTKWAGTNNESDLGTYAWFTSNSGSTTHEVGTTPKANSLGIYDMSGNVWEWCMDWYDSGYYKNSTAKDPVNLTKKASLRVLRGGSWGNFASGLRVAYRGVGSPTSRNRSGGFRVVALQD